MQLAIEAKASKNIDTDYLKGLRSLAQEYPNTQKIVVCLESKKRKTKDGILILPYLDFSKMLWSGGLIS